MDFRDTVSAELPAPRDDEPAGLRQDILDELADHLACSYNRELLRGAKPVEARRRVIERFGDPAAVACRLWLDAMKGKIMARRMMIATCLVVTMASLSVAGVMWNQSARAQRESARAVAEAVRLMAEQNHNAQAGQQELLKQLREMSETVRSTKSLEWNPVTFKLTEETADGPPVAGAEITLTEWALTSGGGMGGVGGAASEVATRTTDRSGIADLGLVRPGEYTFHITRSWDQGSEVTSGQFKIEPGSRIDRRVICPKVPLERVPVRVRLDWPADLAKENLTLYAAFGLEPIRREEKVWTISDVRPDDLSRGPGGRRIPGAGAWQPATRIVLLGPGTATAQVRPSKDGAYLWTSTGFPLQQLRAEVPGRDLREIKEPSEALEFERGTYRLNGLLILRPWAATDVKPDRRRFEVLLASEGMGMGTGLGKPWWVWDHPPTDEAAEGPPAKAARLRKGARANARGGRYQQRVPLQGGSDLTLPWESWHVEKSFEARPGQVNEWTIPLWDELLEAVHKRLRAGSNVEKAE